MSTLELTLRRAALVIAAPVLLLSIAVVSCAVAVLPRRPDQTEEP